MKILRRFRRMAVLLAATSLVTSGCGNDSNPASPQPQVMSQESADDVVLQTTFTLQFVGGDLEPILESQPLAAESPSRVRPARALFDTTYAWNGLTYEATRTYYDALDMALPAYGPTAVRVHWTSRASGTVMGERDTATVGRNAALDLRGIQAGQDTLRLDGTAQDTLLSRFRSFDGTRTRYFYWTSGLTIANVRNLKSTLQTGFRPLSGTVTLVVSADRLRSNNRTDVETHLNVTVVITFNGSQQAEVVVDGRYRYLWDLDTQNVTRV